MASASFDRTVTVWDTATGELVETLRGHHGPVNTVVFTSPGNLVTGSGDFTLKLWDTARGKEVATRRHHEDRVTSVAFAAADSFIVSGSVDRSVKLWRLNPPRSRDARDSTEQP